MKIESIQYLRAFAAILVVIAHSSWSTQISWLTQLHGAVGVDIFFMISGFIITYITHSKVEKPAAFLIKRFFRIWPIFFIVWLVSSLFVFQGAPLQSYLNSLFFQLQDFSSAGPNFGNNLIGPPWTLTYEILFYFIFTLSMLINYRYRSYICSAFFVITTVGFQLFYNDHYQFSALISPNNPTGHWWTGLIKLLGNTILYEFVTGMMLAEVFIHQKIKAAEGVYHKLLCLTLIVCGVWLGLFSPEHHGLTGAFWLALVLFFTVIMLGYHQDKFRNKVMIYLGDMSYSLYLVHYPILIFILKLFPGEHSLGLRVGLSLLAITSSLVVSAVSFKYIEKPCIKLGRYFLYRLQHNQ